MPVFQMARSLCDSSWRVVGLKSGRCRELGEPGRTTNGASLKRCPFFLALYSVFGGHIAVATGDGRLPDVTPQPLIVGVTGATGVILASGCSRSCAMRRSSRTS